MTNPTTKTGLEEYELVNIGGTGPHLLPKEPEMSVINGFEDGHGNLVDDYEELELEGQMGG